ncbi:putative phosphoglycerate mutase pmu1 [Sporothrix bragantina]|uniref:Phosphoglycerate mutase pmu1 n=1 Tax=Sporothrix bragantina TaxID=671064 RepID=A0ABP0BQX7_9PEZI
MIAWFSLRRILVCLAAVATLLALVHSLSSGSAYPRTGSDPEGNAGTMALNNEVLAGSGKNRARFTYTTVTGIFLQSEASTIADGFDYATTDFGLIARAYPTDGSGDHGRTQWQRFTHYVNALNEAAREMQTDDAGAHVYYKVLFMGRHGEGDHNVAEALYGTPAWNCYWAQQDGNGTVVWADAHLTPTGEAQASKANRFWASQLTDQKQPAPQRYYSSPLTRCLQTASITFGGLALPFPFQPTIKEFLREDVSTHTCDRRATRSELHSAFPVATFEDGFAEKDPMWTGISDETPAANDVRSRILLDDIFSSDASTWVSFTSHSGEITSLLRVLGHRTFPLSTGQIIPVLVRAESLPDDKTPSPPSNTEWAKADTCKSPPITSVQGQGCMCSPTGRAANARDNKGVRRGL